MEIQDRLNENVTIRSIQVKTQFNTLRTCDSKMQSNVPWNNWDKSFNTSRYYNILKSRFRNFRNETFRVCWAKSTMIFIAQIQKLLTNDIFLGLKETLTLRNTSMNNANNHPHLYKSILTHKISTKIHWKSTI